MFDFSFLEPYFPFLFKILLFIVFVSTFSSVIRLFHRLVSDDYVSAPFEFPELPVNEKKVISSEIKESISDGTFDIDDASERWAKYYEDEFKAR